MTEAKSGQSNNGKGAGGPHACHVGEWITTTRTTQFVYDGPSLLGEYEASGKAQQETVWMGNTPVATLKDGQLYAVHTDQLGAPRALTDANGTVVWRWEPAPFGDTPANEDPDGDGNHLTYNLRFPGQYYDGETGNHYNYFRDYNPGTGRYIESDPIGLDGGLNTYGYVGGSPLSHIDPTGQFLTSVDAACMHDPQFCVEVMGQMAKNSAAMSGDPCLEEAAERLTDTAEMVAVVATVTAVVRHVTKHVASGVTKEVPPLRNILKESFVKTQVRPNGSVNQLVNSRMLVVTENHFKKDIGNLFKFHNGKLNALNINYWKHILPHRHVYTTSTTPTTLNANWRKTFQKMNATKTTKWFWE